MTAQLPWLYIIALRSLSLIYVGETFDKSGLISRIGAHFGAYTDSTLKQRVEQISGVRRITGPVLVVAARLPFAEDTARVSSSSKQVRLAVEARVHEKMVTEFLRGRGNWAVISTPQPSSITQLPVFEELASDIVRSFSTVFDFTLTLATNVPFHLILLEDILAETAPDERSIGDQIEQIEVMIFNFVILRLKSQFGDRWWTDGVPGPVRRQCVERREEEGAFETTPQHAYLTLINIKEIVYKNWVVFQPDFERASGQNGRDKSLKWIDDLNEIRKQWAHPVKKIFRPLQPDSLTSIRLLYRKVSENFRA